ncbi:MAG TPA: DUF6600 domain-containing protein [Thermoanaerobaculia bacterium]|jgi:hypothetical protein|nr:DUF6600 domain-containing protein [Thermoanaerobaculia bacterium]
MKKAVQLTLLTFALAIPVLADEDDRDRHQSYLSYDDGGTVVRSGEDGREIEAHRNLPIYPGDEVVTARRGRAEVRLSDGNIIGIDRASALQFRSILDAYDGEGNETVVELKYGKVAVHRTDIGRDHVRLDTNNASYLAENEAVYSVETDSRGRDRVTVFDGSLEVRTPRRSTRLREGESANVDDNGVYDLLGDQRASSDDFERWFLSRAERFGSYNSKYMDRRLSYWQDDLDDHGRWVFATGIGWSWRPYVAVGWRPYHNGYWYNRGGCLTWVSYDPWGWGTYHYGRWAFDPGYGWVWVPGYGYSPAWVYWMYGSGYVGWAPAGWWDCYRPYYNWAYNPYRHYGHRFGFGFYGRVRVNDLDLRPWTFVDSRGIISNRIDRAALTADAVKQRLGRSRDGFATVGGGPSRFTREEWNDPAEAVRRRGIDGRHTGAETGAGAAAAPDMTPFFRRDGEVGSAVRDRIIRSRSGSGTTQASGSPSRNIGGGSGSVAPIGTGSVAPIGRGSVAPIAPGTGSERRGDTNSGRVGRGGTPPSSSQPADTGPSSGSVGRGTSRGRDTETPSESETPRSSGPSWRDRARERDTQATPPSSSPRDNDSTWRRIPDQNTGDRAPSGGSSSSSGSSTSSGSSDVPRRVIDGVGGARIRPRDSGDSTSSRGSSSSGSRERSASTGSRDRSSGNSGSSARSSDGGGSSSGSSGSSGSSARSGSSDSGKSSSSGSSNKSSGSSSRGESGGKVKRD